MHGPIDTAKPESGLESAGFVCLFYFRRILLTVERVLGDFTRIFQLYAEVRCQILSFTFLVK